MKVAMIGLGNWGQVLLNELRNQVEVKYECDSKTDLASIFADREIEAVFIATPTSTHFEIAEQALNANKHVFVEKPGTDSSEKLEKLVKLSEDKELVLAVGYEFPHHPAAKKIKELIGGKPIRLVDFDWRKWGKFNDDASHHLLCHDLSLMLYWDIENLTPLSYKKTSVITDTDIIQTEFANARSTINRVSPIKQKTVTVLTDNDNYIWSNNELFGIDSDSRELIKIEVDAATAVSREISDFIAAIREKREPQSSGRFAIEVYKIIERVGL